MIIVVYLVSCSVISLWSLWGSIVAVMNLIGRAVSHGLVGSIPNRRRMLWAGWHCTALHCLQDKVKIYDSRGRGFRKPQAFQKHDETRNAHAYTLNSTIHCFL